MTKKYPLLFISIRNGLIGAVLGVVLLLILYALGVHPFLIPIQFDFRFLLFAVFLFFTLKELRDYYQEGTLYFWQGMIMSFVFTLVYALTAALLIWLYTYLKPDFVTEYVRLFQERARAFPPPPILEKIGKEAYERSLQALSATRGIDMALLYWKQSIIISFFVSIIISVILRRLPKS